MDEQARQELIAQATIQDARDAGKRARANMPFGVVLVALGIAVVASLLTYIEVPGIVSLFGIGVGSVLIPAGIAVIVKSSAAIARERRVIRELGPPK